MQPRGRGRAGGGRARGDSARPQNRPGMDPAGPPRQQQGSAGGGVAPPQGAWGRPQGPGPNRPPVQPQVRPQQQRSAWSNPTANVQQQQGGSQQAEPLSQTGRGAREVVQGSGNVDNNDQRQQGGAGAAGGGNGGIERGGGNGGNVRGRINRMEVIHTKPSSVPTKHGVSGGAINLTANYYNIINKPDWRLHQYAVDFNPNLDDTRMRGRLVRIAYKDEADIGGFLFDGTMLFSPLRQVEPAQRVARLENAEPVVINVKRVGELKWGDHHYLQVFNILVRKSLQMLNLQLIGREYFDSNSAISIPEHKLTLWPGYFTSIRQHEKSIMMTAEITNKVMRSDNVYDLLLNCRDRNGTLDFQQFTKKIIGSVILTYYNNKTYRIDDVSRNETPENTFEKRDGTRISYIDYFQTKYRVRINVRNQPMLISRSSPRELRAGMPENVYLVPELCQMTGLTDEQRANFHLMSALAVHTRISPKSRQEKLHRFVERLTTNTEIMNEFKRWDLSFANKLVQIPGRVLAQETIRVGRNVAVSAGPKADWTMHLRSNSMLYAPKMGQWVIVTLESKVKDTDSFANFVCKAASGMQWDLRGYKIETIQNDRSGTYLTKLEEVFSRYPDAKLIMCILPNKAADRYNAIKKKCCVDRGIPSQVVLMKNLNSKGVMSIATKVAIQMNCKIGGAPWLVPIPMKGLMIIGYDVCRDTANRGKSFGGMVASLDDGFTRYFSSVAEHQREEELSDNFGAFVLLACQKYKETNGGFPEKICIYRDAVGDGQIPYVLQHELKNILAKLCNIYGDEKNIKLAFVIVSKRINTRIFYGESNPPPGTVVDDIITLPERYDFFIVSQCVNQGTVAPTSFNVIHDTMGLTADRMQMLSYKLCHMYYNWSGTVRVPAPCQYAHKLAFLTAQSLHRPANRRLETVLFYL